MSGPPWHLEHVEEIDSTNRAVVERARGGAPEGLVLSASHQSQGRGRLGRTWSDRPDSALLCSILLRPDLGVGQLQWAVVAVALAARSALVRRAVPCALKWPNDLMVRGAKLGGVLAEYVAGPDAAVVVGLGVNLRAHPEDVVATDVGELVGEAPTAARLLQDVLDELTARRALLASVEGRRQLAVEYREALETIGRSVRVEEREREWTGTAVDVDDDGSLLVRTGDGIRRVLSGDVVHVRGVAS